MKKIFIGLVTIFLLSLGTAHAVSFRADNKRLTISGTAINATVIPANTTVTSDSVYQTGNVGFQSIATQVAGANASVTITYQVSYDNSKWWTPYIESNGTLTSVGTISTSQTSDTWVAFPATLTPYIRFNFAQGSGGAATITADTLLQTAS